MFGYMNNMIGLFGAQRETGPGKGLGAEGVTSGEVGWAEKEKNCKHLPRSPSPREKDRFAGMYDYAAKMSIVLKPFP